MTRTRLWRSSLLCFLTLILLPVAAYAQGSIGGVVRDSSGAVLPGVTVEASSPALIERTRSVATDGRGQYLLIDLRPGTYSVTFTLAGFGTVKRDGLMLEGSVTLPVNVQMMVGTLAETLTVTGETPLVDVQNVRQQSVLNAAVLESVPRSVNPVQIGAMLPGLVNSVRDAGGSRGEYFAGGQLTVHGSRGGDQTQTIDGMAVSDLTGSSGYVNNAQVPGSAVQEYTFDTSGSGAETSTGGVRINAVPKEGGNMFRGSFIGNLTTQGMTTSTLPDRFKQKWGITKNDQVDRIWNFNPSLGGPLMRDKLWFFTTYKNWGANRWPVDAYHDDGVTPAKYTEELWAALLRLTWQASPRNKVSAYYDYHWRWTPGQSISNVSTPEASTNFYNPHLYVAQIKWSSPLTSRLLLEAGISRTDQSIYSTFNPEFTNASVYPTREQTTGVRKGNVTSDAYNPMVLTTTIASASYVTGTHALRVGFQHIHGHRFTLANDSLPLLVFNNGAPFQVQLSARPQETRPALKHDLGIYAQDQWRITTRLNLNLGLRFDYNNQQVDEQTSAAGTLCLCSGIGTRHFDVIKDVPKWYDTNPRFGAVYDLFGNGRTAIKTSLNRYVLINQGAFANSVNPMNTAGTDTRTWTDNGDRKPTLDELGPSTNLNFGKVTFSTVPSDELRKGWGVRPNNWEYGLSVQQELFPGLSASVGYYRRWFGNLTWTNNVLLKPTDYTPFTITSPLNGERITLYNLDPAKRGVSQNIIELAPENSEVFDGVDVTVNGRFRGGILVNGGVTMGRTVTDSCSHYFDPNTLRFCKVTPDFMALNTYKGYVVYPAPYNIQLSGVFTSTSGPTAGFGGGNNPWVLATYTVTSAIAGVPLTNGSITTQLVEPGTLFGDRMNRVDFRAAKAFRFGPRARVQGIFDLFNVFNVLPVNTLDNTYGPSWQRPSSILDGRLAKIGVQLDF